MSKRFSGHSVRFHASTPSRFEKTVASIRPYLDARFEDWSADYGADGKCAIVAYSPPMTRGEAQRIAQMMDEAGFRAEVSAWKVRPRKGVEVNRRKPSSKPVRKVRPKPRAKLDREGARIKPKIVTWPKGAMHRHLGVPEGKRIPIAKLKRAARGTGVWAGRARTLLRLRGHKDGK